MVVLTDAKLKNILIAKISQVTVMVKQIVKYNKSTGICGDGLIKGSEQCDDANKLNG